MNHSLHSSFIMVLVNTCPMLLEAIPPLVKPSLRQYGAESSESFSSCRLSQNNIFLSFSDATAFFAPSVPRVRREMHSSVEARSIPWSPTIVSPLKKTADKKRARAILGEILFNHDTGRCVPQRLFWLQLRMALPEKVKTPVQL